MPEATGAPAVPLIKRSEVRRLRLFEWEQVTHQQHGQEWTPHWHAEWSFGAIVEGECHCSVAGRPFLAQAGDLIVIAPGVVHTGALAASPHSGGAQVVMLYVPDAWLRATGTALPPGSGRVRAPALARAARDLTTPNELRDWLHRATATLVRRLPPHGTSGEASVGLPSEAVRALIARMQAAMVDGEQTVAGLAKRCEVSRERLHRVLRQWLGMTPSDYLRAVRLHRAKQLIVGGEPVAAVAAECGFADQAHFTRWFKRTFGYTPGDLMHAASTQPE